MAKKIWTTLFVIMLVLTIVEPSWAENKVYQLGSHLQLEAGDRFTSELYEEPACYDITDHETGAILSLTFLDDFAAPNTASRLVDDLLEQNDGTLGNIKEIAVNTTTNAVRWAGVISEVKGNEYTMVIGTIGRTFMSGFLIGDSFDVAEDFMNCLHYSEMEEGALPEGTEKREEADLTIHDYAGSYDLEVMGERYEEARCIMTEKGHGRLILGENSATFDYSVEEGKCIIEGNTVTLEYIEEGCICISIDYGDFIMRKRAVPENKGNLAGLWKGYQIDTSLSIDECLNVLLQGEGILAEACFYDNNTADWKLITQGEEWVAMGWGEDSQGFYLENGKEKWRITLEDRDRMEITAPGDNPVTIVYRRMEEGDENNNLHDLGDRLALDLGDRYHVFNFVEGKKQYIWDYFYGCSFIAGVENLEEEQGLSAEETKEMVETLPERETDFQYIGSPVQMEGFTWIPCKKALYGKMYTGFFAYVDTEVFSGICSEEDETIVQDLMSSVKLIRK